MSNPLTTESSDAGLRKSGRDRKLTDKAQQNLEEDIGRRVKRVTLVYEQWREYAANTRKSLRTVQPLEQLQELHVNLKQHQDLVVDSYECLRKITTPDKKIVSKVDNCCSISNDLLETLMRLRLQSPEEFDGEEEREKARGLKYAHPSVFGESVSDLQSVASKQSGRSTISSLKARAGMEKAEKLARAKALQEEQLQKSKILHMQMRMEEERMRLEAIQADAAVRVASAKWEALSEVVEDVGSTYEEPGLNPLAASFRPESCLNDVTCQRPISNPPAFASNLPAMSSDQPVVGHPITETSLAKALACAMDRNRLPVPTPKVFSGNPIEFVSFKGSFKTLIENRGISAEEKIYYLQQYITGEAKESIAGCFYGTQEIDYQRAWDTLEKRYGHPFKITEAFRERLEKWPKISQQDGAALQRYADFLRSCLDAMSHVKGLSVLNDCKKNQKMTAKLPDWAINRWSRVVTDSLDQVYDYPTFAKFVSFVEKEARVAHHPVASLSAVKRSDPQHDVKPKRGEKSRYAGTLATNAENSTNTPASNQERPKSCPFCKGEHYLSSCTLFGGKNMADRTAFIKEQKRCFSCLRTGHFSKQCKARHTCQKCKGRHPTVLHDDHRKTPSTQDSNLQSRGVNTAVSLKTTSGHSSTTNVLPVWVSSISNPQTEKLVYALLDTQSDSTFIDKKICEDLAIPADPVKLKLTTMLGRDATVMSQRATGIRVRGYTSGQYIDLPVTYTRDFIPLDREHIPTWETAKSWDHLASISQEIPPLLDCEVGLLIGYNCSTALAPRQVITGETGQPYAVRTDLGWSVVGRLTPADSTEVTGFCHRISLKEAPPVTPRDVLTVLERDFADTKQGDVNVSHDDIQFLKIMESSIALNVKGHLEMPLPFRTRPCLPNNRRLAVIRLSHLKKHLDRDPKYKDHYMKFVERDGDAELAVGNAEPGEVCYIPHHGIYHPKKPNKLRVVFDCSAKYQGSSLNDHLLSGPDLTNSLFGVLCRFRRERVAVMCDVEKMFHRFHVHPKDRDYLRFLSYQQGDTSKDPLEYRMNVHLFGAKSSPGCANFGLKQLSRMYEKDYPLAAPFLRQDFYVDDGVTSVRDIEKAKRLIHEARELCSQGNLRLHKFVSNDRSVVESIPVSERATEIQEVDLSKDELPVERTLGTYWNIESDAFTFQISIKERPNTRRGILSVVASMYDPLGFISPFVLEGKAILQEMCRRGISWDDPICDDLSPRWERWKRDIPNLEAIHIPRCYKPCEFGPETRVELHHFSDASTVGYGTCSYIRFIEGDRVHCSLVVGKARVSPTKVVTVPRLELTAAVVAVKMSIKVKQELQIPVDEEYFWCDSQVVLAYINNEARKFHVFVSNRVQFIREHTEVNQWQHVSTKENPADHASRGLSASDLLSTNWFTGPEFLWKADSIGSCSVQPMLMVGDPEVRAEALNVQTEISCDVLERMSRYSTWSRLSRIVARIRRLAKGRTGSKMLTVEEINEAGLSVIRLVQKEAFKEEVQVLKSHPKREIPSSSKLFNLNPFIQEDMIRVGGRLKNSSLSLDERHPVILPNSGFVTDYLPQSDSAPG